MKHIYKYIFATIIALLLTSLLQSAPKAYDSLGNELEALQKDCEQYLKDPQVSKKLKATCEKFNLKVSKAFKVGYPLDDSVESGTADEKKAARYLTLLLKADESGDNLIEVIKSDTINARRDNNIKYFRFLIGYNKIALSSKNYEFMKQHHDEFQDHPVYKQAIKNKIKEQKVRQEGKVSVGSKKENRSKRKVPKMRLDNWGKRSAYYDNEYTSYLVGQECQKLAVVASYKGNYGVIRKFYPGFAVATIDHEASKKAGSVKYSITCSYSKKNGKVTRGSRNINKRVSKHGILKVVKDECEFRPEDECMLVKVK